jgi:hypothetical protein
MEGTGEFLSKLWIPGFSVREYLGDVSLCASTSQNLRPLNSKFCEGILYSYSGTTALIIKPGVTQLAILVLVVVRTLFR